MAFYGALLVVPITVFVAWASVGLWQPPGWRARTFYTMTYVFCVVGVLAGWSLQYLPPIGYSDRATDNWNGFYGFTLGCASFLSMVETKFLRLLGGVMRQSLFDMRQRETYDPPSTSAHPIPRI